MKYILVLILSLFVVGCETDEVKVGNCYFATSEGLYLQIVYVATDGTVLVQNMKNPANWALSSIERVQNPKNAEKLDCELTRLYLESQK